MLLVLLYCKTGESGLRHFNIFPIPKGVFQMSQVSDAGSKKTITFTMPTPFFVCGLLGAFAILSLLFDRLPEMVTAYPLETAGWLTMFAAAGMFLFATNYSLKSQLKEMMNDEDAGLPEEQVAEDFVLAQVKANVDAWTKKNPGCIPVLMTATQAAECTELRSARLDGGDMKVVLARYRQYEEMFRTPANALRVMQKAAEYDRAAGESSKDNNAWENIPSAL